jgi:predicted amidohydrolase YtcJ
MGGSIGLMELDLRYVPSVADVQKQVSALVGKTPAGQLIRGRGWDHELFEGKTWPTRHQLDQITPDHPVVLTRTDGHSIWVNSRVIRKAGITRETPDPPGGTIVRDEKGEPTGIFKESAIALLNLNSLYPLSEADKKEQSYQALLAGLDYARKLGVTSFQHLNGDADLFDRIQKEGKLTARVSFSLWLSDNPLELDAAEAVRKRYPAAGDWIRFGYMKGFIDGTLGSGTALFFEPFADNPASSGLPQMGYEELEKKVLATDARGFQIGIHAIGDKGNHWILNAYERAAQVNGQRDARHRSEHAQVLGDNDLLRFARLGVIASMQPTHCITDKRFAEKRLGIDRCKGAYAWRRLLDSGAHLAFGTDWPVEPLDPMEGLYAAVTRKDRGGETGEGWFPEQRITMEEAIGLYTTGAAYAEFMEDRKGMLREGMLADMVLMDQDLLSISPDRIMKTRVDLTIVGGRVVYDRSLEER